MSVFSHSSADCLKLYNMTYSEGVHVFCEDVKLLLINALFIMTLYGLAWYFVSLVSSSNESYKFGCMNESVSCGYGFLYQIQIHLPPVIPHLLGFLTIKVLITALWCLFSPTLRCSVSQFRGG